MKFREVRKERLLIEPVEEEDLFLFMHCAGGMINVVPKKFNEHVRPLLLIHGVRIIEFEQAGARDCSDKALATPDP